jgi:hypothetical protein
MYSLLLDCSSIVIYLLSINEEIILYMPKTGIEPISKSYKEFILPIKLFRPLPWERIELTYLYLQNSALTTKQPRLSFYVIIFN